MFGRFRLVGLASVVAILGSLPIGAAAQDAGADNQVVLKNFHRGVFQGGSRHYIFWSMKGDGGDKTRVSIGFSRNGGEEWESIADGIDNTGRFLWSLPDEDGVGFRLRIKVAGDDGKIISSTSAGNFAIDTAAPDVVPYCKVPGETFYNLDRSDPRIRFNLPTDPGPASIVELEIWATKDAGKTWRKIATGRPSDGSIPIRISAMETGIVLVALDAAGNRDNPPTAGSKPELRLLWLADEPPPPETDFEGISKGDVFNGSASVELRWNPPFEYDGVTARIEIQVKGDNRWKPLGMGLHWRGTKKVVLPRTESFPTFVRVILDPEREDLGVWERRLGPFRIHVKPPEAKIKKVEEE
ncbi:MAG: hypothetical protein O7H41_07240 [Planctomycetota bacterium]|nr:hypothetical protein [Planctomycetota bacterium]